MIEQGTTVENLPKTGCSANDNEHGIKLSQNNLQSKYTFLLHMFWEKQLREKQGLPYDFFLTHTFNGFYSLVFTVLARTLKIYIENPTQGSCCVSDFTATSPWMCQGVWERRPTNASNTK